MTLTKEEFENLKSQLKEAKSMESLRKQGAFDSPKPPLRRSMLGEVIPTGTAIAGQIVGGRLGGLPGASAGGAILGGAGEALQQGIEKMTGEREKFDPSQIITTAAISGVSPGASKGLGLAVKPLQPAAKATANFIRPKIINTLTYLSGYGREVVENALKRTPGAIEAITGGEKTLTSMVKRSIATMAKKSGEISAAFGKELNEIAKNESLGGLGQTASRKLQLDEVGDFMRSAIRVLRGNKIGVTKNGLLFEGTESKAGSRITSAAEQKNIKTAFKELSTILKNTSVKNVEQVLENIRALKKFDTSTGRQASIVVQEIFEEAEKVAMKLYPKLGELRARYGTDRQMIEEGKDLFGKNFQPDAQDVSRVTKRLFDLYTTGNLEMRESAKKVGKVIGEDITGTVAGAIMKVDDAFSFRAKNLGVRGVIEKAIDLIPRTLIDNYVATGKITGSLLEHEAIKQIANALGVTTNAAAQWALNIAANKKKD